MDAARIHAFFDRLGVDDHAARALLAPIFSWWISGAGQVDERFIEIGARMTPHLRSPVRFHVVDMLIGDNEAFVEVEESATLKNGTEYRMMSAYRLIDGDDGLIRHIREYTDTRTSAEIWSGLLAEDALKPAP